jgi:hypothetical protein
VYLNLAEPIVAVGLVGKIDEGNQEGTPGVMGDLHQAVCYQCKSQGFEVGRED